MPFEWDDDDRSNFSQCLGASPGSPVSSHNASNELECSTAASADFQRPIQGDSRIVPHAIRYSSPNRHPKSPEWVRRHTNVELDRSAWQYSDPVGPNITSGPSEGQNSPSYSTAAIVTNRLDAKVFAFYVKQAGPWVRRESRSKIANSGTGANLLGIVA